MLSRLKKQKRREVDPKNKLFGSPLATGVALSHTNTETHGHESRAVVPSVVTACIDYITHDSGGVGIEMEGIFRTSGSFARIQQLREAFDLDPTDVGCVERLALDVADAAALLKRYLRDLPDPLFPPSLYPRISECLKTLKGTAGSPKAKARALRVLLDEADIPAAERALLDVLRDFLRRVAANADRNLMTAANLGIVFAPNLIRVDGDAGFVEFGPEVVELWLAEVEDDDGRPESESDSSESESEWVPLDITVSEAMDMAAAKLHAWNAKRKGEGEGEGEEEAEPEPEPEAQRESVSEPEVEPEPPGTIALPLTALEKKLADHRRRVEMERRWRAEHRRLAALESKAAGKMAAPSLIGAWMSRNEHASRLAEMEAAARGREREGGKSKSEADRRQLRLMVQAELERLKQTGGDNENSESESESESEKYHSFLALDIFDLSSWIPWFAVCAGVMVPMYGVGFGGWAPKRRLRPVKIEVAEHEIVAESYTEYVCNVVLRDGDIVSESATKVVTVRRRYSEIRALHLALVRRLGITQAARHLPPFPPRRFLNLNNLDPRFVADRAVLLQRYLQGVLEVPVLTYSDVVSRMLGCV